MTNFLWVQAGIKRRAERSTGNQLWIRKRGTLAVSGRQVEAVAAEQAEIVGQYMAVERLAKLSANRTTTDASGQTAENGARYRTECDADGAGKYAEGCTGLAACKSSTDATGEATDSADGCAGFHGVMERSDFGGVTAGALQ